MPETEVAADFQLGPKIEWMHPVKYGKKLRVQKKISIDFQQKSYPKGIVYSMAIFKFCPKKWPVETEVAASL